MSVQCSFYNKFIMSWTSMFNEATFREILFPSSSNVNDYVAHIYVTHDYIVHDMIYLLYYKDIQFTILLGCYYFKVLNPLIIFCQNSFCLWNARQAVSNLNRRKLMHSKFLPYLWTIYFWAMHFGILFNWFTPLYTECEDISTKI